MSNLSLRRGRFIQTTAGLTAASIVSPVPAQAISYRKPAVWGELVAAATKEGQLTIYGPPEASEQAGLVDGFANAFPAIKITGAYGMGAQLQSRLLAERSGQRYLADVWINGSSVALLALKPEGALKPLEPMIVLPEILDPAAWFQHELWWTDAKPAYTNYMFAGIMFPPAYVNTALINPKSITSYWDLTNPKWRGKIGSTDIRQPGPGGVPARFIYSEPSLGQRWFARFFGTLDAMLSSDQRQLVDWLAEGRIAIAAFISPDIAGEAIAQGLPLAPITLGQLKEGGAIAPGTSAVSILNPAPHPSAAKLYLNWLLSREGQRSYQAEAHWATLRSDVPRENVRLAYEPRRGYTYPNGGSEAYSRLTGSVFDTMISNILGQAGRL